jgi:hypothetical protein
MKCAIEVGKPDWRPLENAIPPDYAEDFMFMGKAGDIVLYKHRLTRRYLNIDAVTGKFYRYANGSTSRSTGDRRSILSTATINKGEKAWDGV